MPIYEKSREVLQAQLAVLANEARNHNDMLYLLERMGSLATDDLYRETTKCEYARSDNGQLYERPAGTKVFVADLDVQKDLIKSLGGYRNPKIAGRAEALGAYYEFEPAVKDLLSQIDNKTPKTHQQYLGGGHHSSVFSLEHGNQRWALRVAMGRRNPYEVDYHIAGTIQAGDMAHAEKIRAISYDQSVTIAEIMPGKELDRLTAAEIRSISNSQVEQYADTMAEAHSRKLRLDHGKASNFFYDPAEGFGFVDFTALDTKFSDKQSTLRGMLESAIDPFLTGFYPRGHEDIPPSISDPDLGHARIELASKYVVSASALLDASERQEFLSVIGGHIDEHGARVYDHQL